MTNYVGLNQQNALAQGGQGLGKEAQGLRTHLANLVSDLERDKDAMRGGQLGAFQGAKNELFQRFDELVRWCNAHGITLGDAQTQVNQSDTTNESDFQGAGSGLSGLARPINF